jgi:transposase
VLRGIPFIGPIRAARRIALIPTPHRFRTQRPLWTYSGLGIETHSSAEQRFVQGELRRAKKPPSIRGLNRHHNHELKNVFKSAATVAAAQAGPFQEFYDALRAQGIRPEMARLTLARKMAAITLIVWKKGVRFEAQRLKPQTA